MPFRTVQIVSDKRIQDTLKKIKEESVIRGYCAKVYINILEKNRAILVGVEVFQYLRKNRAILIGVEVFRYLRKNRAIFDRRQGILISLKRVEVFQYLKKNYTLVFFSIQ